MTFGEKTIVSQTAKRIIAGADRGEAECFAAGGVPLGSRRDSGYGKRGQNQQLLRLLSGLSDE